MKTTLVNLLGGGVLVFGALAMETGCAPTVPTRVRAFPEGHVRNYEFPERTQSDIPYSLERVVIHGQDYYMRKTNTDSSTTQLPFAISRVGENNLSLDLDSSRTELIPQREYIPVLVRLDGDDSTRQDNFADRVVLNAGYSRGTEIQGVRARIVSPEELKKRENAGGRYGWSARTTEQDARYGIITMRINGEEFFFPHVSTQKIDEFTLPFYLVPEKQAQIMIDGDGIIRIQNRNNIFRPLLREHAEVPEDKKYKAIDLFKNTLSPEVRYYIIGEQGFREFSDGRIEQLDEEHTIMVKQSIIENILTPQTEENPQTEIEGD